jgi:hypothetical protein
MILAIGISTDPPAGRLVAPHGGTERSSKALDFLARDRNRLRVLQFLQELNKR